MHSTRADRSLRRRMVAVSSALVGVALSVTLSGCGITWDKKPPTATRIDVDVASSLKGGPMSLAVDKFENANPGVRVKLRFSDESALPARISGARPGAVLIASQSGPMKKVVADGEAQTPIGLASDDVEIAVPDTNPHHVSSLADLAKRGVRVATCAAGTDCGTVTGTVLARAHVKLASPLTQANPMLAVEQVQQGRADAAVVFASTVASTNVRAARAKGFAATKVRGIVIPANQTVTISYQMAVLAHAKHAADAQRLVDYLRSDAGQQLLSDGGLNPPVG